MRRAIFVVAIGAAGVHAAAAHAAPTRPQQDEQVLERLPAQSNQAGLRALQQAAAARPNDHEAAVRLARRYFRVAMSDGDPRYIGYAQAALAPWWSDPNAPTDVLIARALLKQYSHDFAPALADLAAAGARDPADAEIWSWRAALHLVQADYAAARTDCARLREHASVLDAVGCEAWVDGLTGNARSAYAAIAEVVATTSGNAISASERLWLETRLAELALRWPDPKRAEQHFRAALAEGITDQYLLAAYADFLLDQKRPAEVQKLLAGWERADALLLRLALAADALKSRERANYVQQLDARFAAAARRGDTLHQQEEARYRLHLAGQSRDAVRIAQANWQRQREPRDARVLLEAAIAASDRAAAQPALDWLAQSRHEDPWLRDFAARAAAIRP